MNVLPFQYRSIIKTALLEDLGSSGDLSSELLFGRETGSYDIVARAQGVCAGLEVASSTFRFVDPSLEVQLKNQDGAAVLPGQTVLTVRGRIASVLTAERTALNFLTHLSGIASLTARFVSLVAGTGVRIVDTRKTLPGLRLLQKYAVRMGGGFNHRFGLYDMVMLKDNHVYHAGGIKEAVSRLRSRLGHAVKIEIEADTLDQFREILQSGADIVLLDNMGLDELKTAVIEGKGKIILEASGGVTENTVKSIAETGVDIISIGKLTHSAPALDFGLDAS